MQYSYDPFGNQTAKTVDCCGGAHVNARTTMAYDGVGNLISVTDPNGNVATGTFDATRAGKHLTCRS